MAKTPPNVVHQPRAPRPPRPATAAAPVQRGIGAPPSRSTALRLATLPHPRRGLVCPVLRLLLAALSARIALQRAPIHFCQRWDYCCCECTAYEIPTTAWRGLHHVSSYLLAPLYGIPPGVYRLHHCVMHHVVRLKLMVSSGMDPPGGQPLPVRPVIHRTVSTRQLALFRDLRTAVRRATWPAVATASSQVFKQHLGRTAALRGVCRPVGSGSRVRAGRGGVRACSRTAVVVQCSCNAVGVGASLCRQQPGAVLWQLVRCHLHWSIGANSVTCRSQHIFIDPAAPRSDYHLAYNCVGVADNQRTFNDGYHVVHHLNSKVHWADMPAQFEATLERQAANDGALR